VKNEEKPIANPLIILREEFDDWAILFDPDTGNAFGLSPTGVYLWKLLDGEHTIDDMLKTLQVDAEAIPQEAGEHLTAFIEELTRHGLAGYDVERGHDDRGRLRYCPTCISEKIADAMQFAYEPPKLVNLNGETPAEGACCSSGTGATGLSSCCTGDCVTLATCYGGSCAGSDCSTGTSALGTWCINGSSVAVCADGSSTLNGNCAGTGMSASSRCNVGSSGTCNIGSAF
jgi:SynChlorMet cassette protein ScmD